jgi:hypothetical protein
MNMPNKDKISLETQVNISMKMFLSLLGGMIALFFGFYSLVVAPKLTDHDKLIEENRTNQTEQLTEINKQLMEMNNGIGNLNGTVDGMNGRFNDLRDLRNDEENTSGGFNND